MVPRSSLVVLAFTGLLQLSGITHAAPAPLEPLQGSTSRISDYPRFLPVADTNGGEKRPSLENLQVRQAGHPRKPKPVKVLYRGDQRSPGQLIKLGGIPPRSKGPTTNETYSLQVHHLGQRKVSTAYVSTTWSFGVAVGFATQKGGPNDRAPGWIYEIHPSPNMIDMDDSLFQTSYASEKEFSAMGGIRWDQITGYMYCPLNLTGHDFTRKDLYSYQYFASFVKRFPDQQFTKNEQYNSAYDKYEPSPGMPQLGGGSVAKEYNQMTTEEWAMDFMNHTGAPVGWKGAFPLNFTAIPDFGDNKVTPVVAVPPRKML
ncbi:heat-labile enterotoxin alpha chain domain-containing protein [Hirsutella rhossiliensis]|uniref:Heat-labile enterotoxin alpha chain domain-containing protein n=1 Tax=Hirsutella rhossiliensis TaxID=111463 RepID=A0A9P8SIP6_9HYPO|nr:heat-labile enterotoxin alpha chain domain-containing protein [Hirsutella rhossiliensis]KAH0962226.1 heat-labile enterotoxin alpha chain domain-containing protein [Hirsutella rhossiliensis]